MCSQMCTINPKTVVGSALRPTVRSSYSDPGSIPRSSFSALVSSSSTSRRSSSRWPSPSCSELSRAKLLSRKLSPCKIRGQSVDAAGQMPQMKTERDPFNFPPDLLLRKPGRVLRQILADLREAEKHRHHKRMNAWDRSTQPRLWVRFCHC